jgi:hypothetical protein
VHAPLRHAAAVPMLAFLFTARFDSLRRQRRPVEDACVRVCGEQHCDRLPWTEQAGEWPWWAGEDWAGGHGGLNVRAGTWVGARLLRPPSASRPSSSLRQSTAPPPRSRLASTVPPPHASRPTSPPTSSHPRSTRSRRCALARPATAPVIGRSDPNTRPILEEDSDAERRGQAQPTAPPRWSVMCSTRC